MCLIRLLVGTQTCGLILVSYGVFSKCVVNLFTLICYLKKNKVHK